MGLPARLGGSWSCAPPTKQLQRAPVRKGVSLKQVKIKSTQLWAVVFLSPNIFAAWWLHGRGADESYLLLGGTLRQWDVKSFSLVNLAGWHKIGMVSLACCFLLWQLEALIDPADLSHWFVCVWGQGELGQISAQTRAWHWSEECEQEAFASLVRTEEGSAQGCTWAWTAQRRWSCLDMNAHRIITFSVACAALSSDIPMHPFVSQNHRITE